MHTYITHKSHIHYTYYTLHKQRYPAGGSILALGAAQLDMRLTKMGLGQDVTQHEAPRSFSCVWEIWTPNIPQRPEWTHVQSQGGGEPEWTHMKLQER